MVLVSIIIPCYNVENYIEECVDSALKQTYKNIEIICIDNNSTDNTYALLLDIQKKYPNIKVDREVRSGACAARNKGLSLVQGDWIQFLDADDLLIPNKIEHQVELASRSECAFVAGAYKKRNVKGTEIDSILLNENKYLAPFLNQCGITSSNLWQKEGLDIVSGWNNNLKSSQETDLMFKLIKQGFDYIIDTSALTIIRERETGQISQRNPVEKWEQYIDIRLDYIEYLKRFKEEEYLGVKNIMYDFLMVSIITLSKFDKTSAIDIYNKKIKTVWKTSCSYGFTKLKYYLIKLIGLRVVLSYFK